MIYKGFFHLSSNNLLQMATKAIKRSEVLKFRSYTYLGIEKPQCLGV